MTKTKWLFVSLIFSGIQTLASGVLKPQVGLGFSDNVNLETSQKDADFYLWTRLLGVQNSAPWSTLFYANIRDYFQQNSSDALQLRLGLSKLIAARNNRELTGNLFLGQVQYFHGSPAAGEDLYNNNYLGATLGAEFFAGPQLAEWETGLQITRFSDFANRVDTQLHGLFSIFNITGELGIVSSSDAYFSRNSMTFEYSWAGQLRQNWLINVAVSLKYSVFPERKIFESIRTSSNKGGKTRWTTQEENESQMLLQINPTLSKTYGRAEFRAGLNLASQSSRSQEADYFETNLMASIQTTF
jgi:hypothetical protein